MSNRPLVSVCTPTYNCAGYIAKLGDSLQAQTCGDFEVLIGDDGSKDDTQEVLAPYLKDPRFRLLAWPNRGYGLSTAKLLAEARGEFWCHPGADDILHPGFIATRVELLRKNTGAVLAHGPPVIIDPQGNVTEGNGPAWDFPESMIWPTLPQLLQHNVITAPSIMARMEATRQVLPYLTHDWRYAFDWYLWLLLAAAAGGDFVWDPVPQMRYRSHPESLTSGPEALKRNQAETRLIPLIALATAAQFSPPAAALWSKYRRPLYALWLTRAAKLSKHAVRCEEWQQLAATAVYGPRSQRSSLWLELFRRITQIVPAFLAEHHAARRQRFRVAGLAQIDDPVFRS